MFSNHFCKKGVGGVCVGGGGGDFYDFMFASVEDEAFPKWDLLLRERICS